MAKWVCQKEKKHRGRTCPKGREKRPRDLEYTRIAVPAGDRVLPGSFPCIVWSVASDEETNSFEDAPGMNEKTSRSARTRPFQQYPFFNS